MRRIVRAPVSDCSWKGDSPDWMFAPIVPGEFAEEPRVSPTVEYLLSYRKDIEAQLAENPLDERLRRELDDTLNSLREHGQETT